MEKENGSCGLNSTESQQLTQYSVSDILFLKEAQGSLSLAIQLPSELTSNPSSPVPLLLLSSGLMAEQPEQLHCIWPVNI